MCLYIRMYSQVPIEVHIVKEKQNLSATSWSHKALWSTQKQEAAWENHWEYVQSPLCLSLYFFTGLMLLCLGILLTDAMTGLRCFLELQSCSSKALGVIWRRFLHSLTLRRKKEKSARPGIPVVLSSWKIYPVACEACTYLSAQSPVWSWSWLGPRWAESCWPRDTHCQWGRDSWGTWGHMGLHPQSLAGSAAGPRKEHGTSSYISLLLMWWKT